MEIIRCDICKREIRTWLRVSFIPDALYDEINVSHLIPLKNSFELCSDCANRIQNLILKGKRCAEEMEQ